VSARPSRLGAGLVAICAAALVALLSLAALPPAAGQPAAAVTPSPTSGLPANVLAAAAAIRNTALRGTRAFDIVRSLTVEVGPRSAGSAGDRAAVEWGLRTLRALGLANVHAEPVAVPNWERGAIAGEIVSPYPQPVVLTALGGSVATPEAGITAEVIAVPSLDAVDGLAPARVRGKIVFFDASMERTKDGSGYGRAVAVRGAGPSRAAKLGAVAVLIRSMATGGDRFAHTGGTRYAEGVPRIPAAALAAPDADLLAAEVASGKPVTFRLRLGSRELPAAQSANVIGEVVGREASRAAPGEVVLIGAHLDSWDLGTGAIDDGAGVAIVGEAARQILARKERPRRTIRVILFANEEFGLSGARAYAEAHAAELPRHVFASESDFGSGRVWRLQSRVAPDRLPLVAAIARLLAPLGVEPGGNDAEGGADITPFAPAGVPVLELDQDGSRYFDYHHTANDTLDKIDPKDLDQNVAAWAAVAWAVADMPGDLGRAPQPGHPRR
jgi:carboxypeptidase Q